MPFALCLLFAGFIAATFIDLEHLIIPDEITLGGTVAGLLRRSPSSSAYGRFPGRHEAQRTGHRGGSGHCSSGAPPGKWPLGVSALIFQEVSRVRFLESSVLLPSGKCPTRKSSTVPGRGAPSPPTDWN